VGSLSGLKAVVTGGASGIGAATVALLRERGAEVAVIDAAALEGAYRCDITDAARVAETIDQIAADLGGIDILVNNAGIGAVGDVTANPDAEWLRVFDVNVFGAARIARHALPHLRLSAHAVIVNTSSIVAVIGVPDRVVYSASKGALAAMTLAMAADHVREGIRVNAVLPGTADTPWVARLLSEADDARSASESLRRRQPMGRLVTAEEVAHAIAYLADPATRSTTGTLLTVDGGMGGLRVATA
jgi:2-keto-3-deoxy-L-fuconate dehydrogenase